MSEEIRAMIWLHVRGQVISAAVMGALIFVLGSTVLSDANETVAGLASMGISLFGLLVGYGISLYWLAREVGRP